MPKKFFKRYAPNRELLLKNNWVRMFGKRLLDQNLWHLNRRSVSGGTAIGIFCMFLPMPFEMIPATIGAILFRVNLPITILWVWVSNPLTWIPLWGPGYLIGAKLLDKPTIPLDALSLQWLYSQWLALWIGCLILGSIVSFLAYLSVRGLWRLHVVRRWQGRHDRKLRQKRVQKMKVQRQSILEKQQLDETTNTMEIPGGEKQRDSIP